MAVKTFAVGELVTASDANTYLANSGLVFVKEVTIGTGVSSVSVSSAFSSDFTNYRIVIHGGVMSVNGSIYLQLNNATGTTYQMYGYYGQFGVGALNAYGPGFATSWTDAAIGSTEGFFANIDISRPNMSAVTLANTWAVSNASSYHFSMRETTTNQHTGFTIGPLLGGATLTGGAITVYGYRKA